jgi:hypothetical protein
LTKKRDDVHRLHAAVPAHAGIIATTDDPDRAALAKSKSPRRRGR